MSKTLRQLRIRYDPFGVHRQLSEHRLARLFWGYLGRHEELRACRPLRASAKKHLREKAATGLRGSADGYRPGLELILDPTERRMVAIFRLEPMRAAAAAVRPIELLGNDALQPVRAGLAKQIRPDRARLERRELDAVDATREQPLQTAWRPICVFFLE